MMVLSQNMITIAKSMGAGMPISGVVGRADIMDAPPPGTSAPGAPIAAIP